MLAGLELLLRTLRTFPMCCLNNLRSLHCTDTNTLHVFDFYVLFSGWFWVNRFQLLFRQNNLNQGNCLWNNIKRKYILPLTDIKNVKKKQQNCYCFCRYDEAWWEASHRCDNSCGFTSQAFASRSKPAHFLHVFSRLPHMDQDVCHTVACSLPRNGLWWHVALGAFSGGVHMLSMITDTLWVAVL